MTLEDYFRKSLEDGKIDHSVRVEINAAGMVQFYIHPDGVDGDTFDAEVSGNALRSL